ncbi:SRPBCC domain-containing protein [Desulfurispira natronophila]|uniref:SRPBCC domain-containing protein n=1 Tax=Desulfurispira natronophila TaxID=682562 RepID=A0A7W8DH27_9BACT|nr:SRPBCC domain-containing protein [Desulfurispira natronophila]MBB5021947.1 hypothetical protein [Desulfurispira natronophila]
MDLQHSALGGFTHQIETSVDIQATPQQVWQVLTDFAGYAQWNPFMVSIDGKAKVGSRLQVRLQLDANRQMPISPKILELDAPYRLLWQGRFLLPGTFTARHIFEITPLDEGRCNLSQREEFIGLLVPFFRRSLGQTTKDGLEAMNQALATEVQQRFKEGEG